MRLFFLILLFTFQFTNSNAEDCPSYNLLENPILKSRKDVSQSDLGWCCSFAFTDALSLKYNRQFSSVDIALNQARAVRRFEGCDSLQQQAEGINSGPGVCKEEDYRQIERMTIDPSRLVIKLDPATIEEGKKLGLTDSEMFRRASKRMTDEMQRMRSQTLSYMQLIRPYFDLRKKVEGHPELLNTICEESKSAPLALFKNITNLKDIIDVIEASAGKSDFEFLANLSEKNCYDRQKLTIKSEQLPMESTDSFKQGIISVLAKGNSPILAIDVRSLFVDKSGSPDGFFSFLRPKQGNHAVNVVGIGLVDNKCMVTIRDSSFGGALCKTRRKSEADIKCSNPMDEKYMTYEIEIDKLKKNTTDGIALH